uniref:Uncharacterized protein n=1 Tax=Oryza sativa subsp. japonica TaxID=39947 RepID=Q2QS60_ORYSJ|nr:hypothetical protein LOC_Os12g25230 [Oryza sativa Japonica Group]
MDSVREKSNDGVLKSQINGSVESCKMLMQQPQSPMQQMQRQCLQQQRDSSILQQRLQSMSQASDFNVVINISHAPHAAPAQWSGKKLIEELHQQ